MSGAYSVAVAYGGMKRAFLGQMGPLTVWFRGHPLKTERGKEKFTLGTFCEEVDGVLIVFDSDLYVVAHVLRAFSSSSRDGGRGEGGFK